MSLKTLILLAAVTFAACNSAHTNANIQVNNATTPAPVPVAQQGAGVDRITTAELEKLLKEGKAIVVDVRSQAAYDLGHIAGAKLIPVPDIGARANELPRDKMIVTYCS
jgi:predicted sulfurtransferase